MPYDINHRLSHPYIYYTHNQSKNCFIELAFEMSWKNILTDLFTLQDGFGIRSLAGVNFLCLLWIILSQDFTAFYFVASMKNDFLN